MDMNGTTFEPSDAKLKKGFNSEDRISQLPDDILVSILSSLTVEEAVPTSILSSRWQHLWKSITRLDFDAPKAKGKMKLQYYLPHVERLKYAEWVTRVLKLHKCSTLDELKIRFDLMKNFSRVIDWWIFVSISKKVRRLELDFSKWDQMRIQDTNTYTFPSRLLHPFTSNRPGMQPRFKFLEALYLNSVDVTKDDIHYFLYQCPFLERLSVRKSTKLQSVHVVGLALPLKYLEFALCLNLKTVEICNTNLISFSYYGGRTEIILTNVRNLVEVSYCGSILESVNRFFNQLSCCLSQLRALTMTFPCAGLPIKNFRPLQNLVKLKEFILNISIKRDESLLGYISWIEVSPSLERFVLKLAWAKETPIINEGEAWTSVKSSSFQYLKLVELAGYYGGTGDFELAMCFIENAISLEKIIIDPHCQSLVKETWTEYDTSYVEHVRRTRARQQLEGKVPSQVELVVL